MPVRKYVPERRKNAFLVEARPEKNEGTRKIGILRTCP